jgi:pimeloyl-ACP methyl ester carboxylesterase
MKTLTAAYVLGVIFASQSLLFAWQGAAPPAGKAPAAAAKPAADAGEPKGPPPPVVDQIHTKDQVDLTITYYASPKFKKGPKDKGEGKGVIPIILLHGQKGQRANCEMLAKDLQAAGYAVVTPDLRGSGASTAIVINGEEKKLDATKFNAKEFRFYLNDIDAVKSYLRKKNNLGELNLEALVVIGSEASAIAAMNWALLDWNAPVLANYKNAQDVKALILLSPPQSVKGFAIEKEALLHPMVGKQMPIMVCAGKKGRAAADEAKRLATSLERNHTQTNDTPEADRKIWLRLDDTNLQGTELLQPSLQTRNYIHAFLVAWVVPKMDEYKWTERKSPND